MTKESKRVFQEIETNINTGDLKLVEKLTIPLIKREIIKVIRKIKPGVDVVEVKSGNIDMEVTEYLLSED